MSCRQNVIFRNLNWSHKYLFKGVFLTTQPENTEPPENELEEFLQFSSWTVSRSDHFEN